LRPDQIASASGLSNFARITAGSFGTSIATTMWSHRASLHHAQLAEHIDAYNPVAGQSIAGLQSQGLSQEQSFALLNRLIDQQTFTMAANDIFFASALIFVALIGLVWLTRPTNAAGAGSAAAAGAH
jgi:DHA2 family multidrug resistance protein